MVALKHPATAVGHSPTACDLQASKIRTGASGADVSELADAWTTLMDVLAELAPRSREKIRPGSPSGPDLVERDLGITLSPALREWFALHGGTGLSFEAMFLPQAIPLSPDEAIADSRVNREIWSEFDDDIEGPAALGEAGEVARTWLADYVMVGADGCGGGLFVDNRPGLAHGCVRWWDKTESDDDYGNGPVAPSLSSLILAVADGLRSGTLLFQDRAWLQPLRAEARDGRLEWTDRRGGQP